MAKITIKELESLTANDAGQMIREDGNLAGRISVRKNGVSTIISIYTLGNQRPIWALIPSIRRVPAV